MMRSIRHRMLCIATLTLLATLALRAQHTGTLVGAVNNSYNMPVYHATVRVLGTNKGAFTSQRGSYTITGIPAGTHDVVFSYPGAEPLTMKVKIEAGRTSYVTQRLYSFRAGSTL